MKLFVERFQNRVPPEQYLSLVNVIATGIGFVKGLVTVSLLTPELFGIVAIIGSINRTMTNFVDIRLHDVAGKLYYETAGFSDEQRRIYRQNVLAHAALGGMVFAVITGVLSFVAGTATIHLFTDAEVRRWWIAAHAIMITSATTTSYLVFLQRFIGHFYTFGTVRVILHILDLAIYVGLFYTIRQIDGYYVANVVGGSIFLILMVISTLTIWIRRDKISISDFRLGYTVSNYIANRSMLIYGNFLGYGKLLHRSADTLVVSYFTNDTITGLYKFARTLADSIYVFYDAVNQVYQPRLLSLLADRALGEFRRLSRRFMLGASGATVVIMLLEIVLLPLLLPLFADGQYIGAMWTIVILTVPFAFNMGFSIWLWQVYIHVGKLARYTLVTLLACVVQYVVMIVLFLTMPPDPVQAALGYLGYYLFAIPIWFFMARQILKDLPAEPAKTAES